MNPREKSVESQRLQQKWPGHERPRRRAQRPADHQHQTQLLHRNQHPCTCQPWTHTCPSSPTRSQTTSSGVSNTQPSPKYRMNPTTSRCASFVKNYFATPSPSILFLGGGSTATSDTYSDPLSTKQKRAKHGLSRHPGGCTPPFQTGQPTPRRKGRSRNS